MDQQPHWEAIGSRDEVYIFKGIMDIDGAFFGVPAKGGKRGRGTNKTPVIIVVC